MKNPTKAERKSDRELVVTRTVALEAASGESGKVVMA